MDQHHDLRGKRDTYDLPEAAFIAAAAFIAGEPPTDADQIERVLEEIRSIDERLRWAMLSAMA
jgi:hypothetical protein